MRPLPPQVDLPALEQRVLEVERANFRMATRRRELLGGGDRVLGLLGELVDPHVWVPPGRPRGAA